MVALRLLGTDAEAGTYLAEYNLTSVLLLHRMPMR